MRTHWAVGLSVLLLSVGSIGACAVSSTTGGADAAPGADGGTADAAPGSDAGVDAGQVDAALDASEDAVTCGEGAACDDGDPCTVDDACDAAGACVGAPKCDDGRTCTADSCDPDGTCHHGLVVGWCEGDAGDCVALDAPDPANECHFCAAGGSWVSAAAGATCDDHDACTTGDQCQGGACLGTGVLSCPDTNPCAAASCDPAEGCVATPVDGACDDSDACTTDDHCQDGDCVGTEVTCDDGDPCTVDACDAEVGCVVAGGTCDDGDPCTEDTCAGDGSCTNAAFTGPCDDGDACTVGEVCDDAGVCAGGQAPDCADDNPCTEDFCDPALGCVNKFQDVPCDDGISCTMDDACGGGVCVGVKTTACASCPFPTTAHASRFFELSIPQTGYPVDGVDVDGDPDTCEPQGQCSDGVDNALSLFGGVLNSSLSDAIAAGNLNYLLDLQALKTDGTPFKMAVYDSVALDALCDPDVETCSYIAGPSSFSGDCHPYFAFDNAVYQDGALTAGGPDTVITMVIPLPGAALPITIARAQVSASVSLSAGDTQVVSVDGVMGGAVIKAQLIAAVDGFDQNVLPIDKDLVVSILESAIEPDIDLDGDGVNEAASIGLRVRGNGARLVPLPAP